MAGIDKKTLAAANGYTRKSLEGAGALKGEKGEPGKDGRDGLDGFSPTIKENTNNTEDFYRLDIEAKNGKFTTPNLMGVIGMEYKSESAGTPVGEIISYMGTIAPEHYLICDGKEYTISDYPYLTKHFTDNFGKVNFFGGDGIDTFAVPDLRGEFLRGTGTAKRNTGSGAYVGIHQEPSNISGTWASSSEKLMVSYFGDDYNQRSNVINADKSYSSHNSNSIVMRDNVINTTNYSYHTLRPTNTAVLYCIKYKPTYWITPTNNEEVEE